MPISVFDLIFFRSVIYDYETVIVYESASTYF